MYAENLHTDKCPNCGKFVTGDNEQAYYAPEKPRAIERGEIVNNWDFSYMVAFCHDKCFEEFDSKESQRLKSILDRKE